MKIISVITILFSTFFSIGQKSYYFSDPLPDLSSKVFAVDKKHYGKYHSDVIARSYEVNELGIAIISTTISSIDRTTIREMAQYDVRNGYIFGVVEDDSLPCVLEGELYYFGINHKEQLTGIDSKNVLTKLNGDEYILNYFDNGVYTPVLLQFNHKILTIKQFDYDLETTIFDFIVNKKSIQGEYHEMIVLSPSKEEYNSLLLESLFTLRGTFKKTRK